MVARLDFVVPTLSQSAQKDGAPRICSGSDGRKMGGPVARWMVVLSHPSRKERGMDGTPGFVVVVAENVGHSPAH